MRATLLCLLTVLAAACGDDGAERGESPANTRDAQSERADAQSVIDAGTTDGEAPDLDAARDAALDAPRSADAAPFAPFDDAVLDALARLVDSDPPVRGVVGIVVHPDGGVVHARGYGDLAPERRFLLGGASMVISAGVLMRLVEQGLLSLDAPIAGALSAWGEHKAGVTLAQLLSASAGLPSSAELRTAEFGEAGRFAVHLCQRREGGTLAECGRAIYQDDTPENNLPPDSVYAGGGSAYQLAGALAEQVSGKRWSELVRETYAPCGLNTLGYTNQYERAPIDYPEFDGDTDRLPRSDNPSIEGGAYLSANDYAKLLLMFLRGGVCEGGRVLSAESVARMQENRIARFGGSTGSPIAPGFGFGFTVNERSGVLSAPGAYGFYPLIDRRRGYGLLLAIEGDVVVTVEIMIVAKRQLDALYLQSN
jgi:CubicO group peptidase (beta-lactamase class C family)